MAKFRSSFAEGVGSILSLQGGYIQMPDGSFQTDAEQLYCDWANVGSYIRVASKEESDKILHSSNYDKRK